MKQFLEKHKTFAFFAAGILGGVVSLTAYSFIFPSQPLGIEQKQNASAQLARYASLNSVPAFDFTGVSEIANPAVVHIKTTIGSSSQGSTEAPQRGMPMDPFEFFQGPGFRFDNPGRR